MAQVMDAALDTGQQLLLTELQSRFPEVPLDVIHLIMIQCYCNRERCIEMLARECQKYRNHVGSSCMDRYSMEDLSQRRESTESLSSVFSGLGGSAEVTPGNPALPMRSSLSYPYIPSTQSTVGSHNPAQRSSLPVISLDLLFPVSNNSGLTDENSPSMGARTSQPATYHSQQDPVSSHGCAESTQLEPSCLYPHGFRRDVSPMQSRNKFKTVTSEVSYRICSPSRPDEQSVGAANATYLSATHVNVLAGEDHDMAHETPGKSQDNLLAAGFPSAAMSSNCSPPGAYSAAVYMHPMQAFVSNAPPSSFSSSHECLASVSASSELSFLAASSTNAVFSSSSCSNGNVSAAVTECVDDNQQYANALRMCQSVNFDKLFCKHQELLLYSNELHSCVGRLETQLTTRVLQRSQAFPTAEDVEKLKQENRTLSFDISLLTREIDLANNGETPLGVLDPEEQQSFRRRDSLRRSRTRSQVSSESPATSPVTSPAGGTVLPSPIPVPPTMIVASSHQQHRDEPEGEHWSCSACTFLNHPALKLCECCEMPRVPSSLQ